MQGAARRDSTLVALFAARSNRRVTGPPQSPKLGGRVQFFQRTPGRLSLRAAPAVVLLFATPALARPHVRRHFEPTDLELEEPGTTELDLEVGYMRGQDAARVITPDFEVDLGLAKWLEVDIDGAYAIEGAPGKPFSFDHESPDPLWPSLKAGVVDVVDDELSRTYAVGAQLGPKLPTYSGGRGFGVEGLVLGGVSLGATQFSFNLGGFVDPAPERGSPRPIGVESGITWDQDLDRAGHYAISTDLSGVVFVSHDPAQLQAGFGPVVEATSWLDLSLTGLVGFLPGSDRYGVVFGFSPHFGVWNPEHAAAK